jgi:endogenous inhibitor of DNA gyrase (YacG/DUF329 family)
MPPLPRCPICDTPVDPAKKRASFPFCSPRCRQIDLGRWLVEGYSITTIKPMDEDEEDPGPAPPVREEKNDDEDDDT